MIECMLYQDSRLKVLRQKLRKNSTDAERALWRLIRKSQVENTKFIRQYSAGRYILDFYSPKLRLAVELDGGQHLNESGLAYDEKRTRFLNSLDQGIGRRN